MNFNLISSSIHSILRHRVKAQRPLIRTISKSTLSRNEPNSEPVDDSGDSLKNKFQNKLRNGPHLKDFFKNEHMQIQDHLAEDEVVPYLIQPVRYGRKRKVFFDVYGCQMNVNDTEIVWAILKENDYEKTTTLTEADVILIVTCAIRDSAEERIWGRLDYIRGIKSKRLKDRPTLKVGILGCMAERLKEKVLETDKTVDVVAGPDAYRDLPRLLALTENNQKSVNVLLSFDETYADITPVRLNENSVSAFVSIMRGCDNMCTYCIVPFTRGRERSRPVSSILREVAYLSEKGVKEITLLGQNVNSYRDTSQKSSPDNVTSLAKGFKTVYKTKKGGLRFADLLHRVSEINPEIRIRFTSPHPKDFPDEVIQVSMANGYIEDELIDTDEEDNFVPRTIQRYLRIVQDNNKGSIFDTEDDKPEQSPEEIKEDIMMRDNGDVVRFLPGQGRGAIEQYYTGRAPGAPCLDDLSQMIRKVNPPGFFDNTEQLSRTFQEKAKGFKIRLISSPPVQTGQVTPSAERASYSSPTKTNQTEPVAAKPPLPMSQMLCEGRKKKEELLKIKQLAKNIEDEEASQLTIQRLLEEDEMKLLRSRDAISSNELSWRRRRTDTSPRCPGTVNVRSVEEFPPLK